MTEKYIIWDTQEKKWFRPTYPGFVLEPKNNKQVQTYLTEELLFSQSGEIYMRNINPSQDKGISCITHAAERFRAYAYTTMKDREERKIYDGHIIYLPYQNKEALIKWCIKQSRWIAVIDWDENGENGQDISRITVREKEIRTHWEDRRLKTENENK